MHMDFVASYQSLQESKDSQLCVGIDPAYPGLRPRQTIPSHGDPPRDILDFASRIIDETGPYASCFKPNLQYIHPLGFEELSELNDRIHEQDALSILDVKLSDIGTSNDACCFWARECGFDAITASPFPGNISSLWESCQARGLGLFLLCLMSNPEADIFMKARLGDDYAYERIAREIESNGITGAVIGATIDDVDRMRLVETLTSRLVLVPGIGAQSGTFGVVSSFGRRCVVNVSRDVIFSNDPAKKARTYRDMIREIGP
jgi:orotidine-5'-phosphate decarboxylase